MNRISFVAPGIAVAGALTPADFAEAARQGFRAVASNRPDGEEQGQLTARDEAVLSWRAGLVFRHVPAAKHEVLDPCSVSAMADALARLPRPLLVHCKSGQRSAILVAAVRARSEPIDAVLADTAAGGIDLSALRDELVELADAGIRLPEERSAA